MGHCSSKQSARQAKIDDFMSVMSIRMTLAEKAASNTRACVKHCQNNIDNLYKIYNNKINIDSSDTANLSAHIDALIILDKSLQKLDTASKNIFPINK
jgi:hypothetical protein